MDEYRTKRTAAYQFVLDHVDSVPHLEALLLLWHSRPRVWPAAEVADRLYVPSERARAILHDLSRQRLIECTSQEGTEFCYASTTPEQDALLQAVDETYREEMVAMSSMIHSKASRAVRDFARAFRFTKDQE